MAEAQDEVPKPSGPVSTARTVPAHRRPRAKGKSKAEAADWLSDAPYAGEEVLKHLETVDNGGPGTWDLEVFFFLEEDFFVELKGKLEKKRGGDLQSNIVSKESFIMLDWGNSVYPLSEGIVCVFWNDQTWFFLILYVLDKYQHVLSSNFVVACLQEHNTHLQLVPWSTFT